MAKPSPYDLNYGHFGQATYNLEDGSWTFDRAPGHERVLHQLGPWKVVLQPASSFLISSSESARDAQQAAKSLGKNKFEIVPSLDVLPALALESTAVKNVTETYDPAIGDLLSFGSIPLEGSSARARRVAAVPGGQCGNLLRLVMLSRDRQGWASDKSIWLEGHTFVNEENASGYWVEDAVPIQQLCFAQTESRSPFLAARFPTKTVLFRPILHHRPRPAMRSRFYDLPASHINPRPILSLSHERTGGAPHAHVTFNPDYQRQLGIVDVTGNWSIWEIDGGHKGARYSVSCVVSGLLNIDAPDPEDETKTAIEDGWSRILWVGDVNTILLCNRRRLEIIGIKGGDPVSLNCPQPVQSHSADWILDIKHHASSKHLFYVLTSSRLIVMAVTCQNDVVGQRDLVPGATVLLSWTHFRGLEDITLQLGIPNVSDDDSKVLLFSHLNSLVTIFEFQANEQDPRPHSGSDPMNLQLRELLDQSLRQSHIASLNLDQLDFGESHIMTASGLGLTYRNAGIRFYRLTAMLSDRSSHQALFYVRESEKGSNAEPGSAVEPPSWSKITKLSGKGMFPSERVGEDEDFIMPDGLETEAAPALTSRHRRQNLAIRRPSLSLDLGPEQRLGLSDYNPVYSALARSDTVEGERDSEDAGRGEMPAITERVRHMLTQDVHTDTIPRGTLLELAESDVTVPDVDGTSAQLEDLFSRTDLWNLRRIASQQALHLADADEETPTISSIYDTILQSWIAPLPTSIPTRVRQSKEQLTRRIAAETVLASSRIRIANDGRASLSALTLGDIAPQPNPMSRLSQHLEITKPLPEVSPNVRQVLMHWTLATHPGSYDWNTTTRTVDEELGINEDDETPSQKDKERLKRKAERLLKRQKRESEIGKRITESQPLGVGEMLPMMSSPVPMVRWDMSSQPQHASQTQSQAESQSQGFPGFVQSQVEPGRHGARPAVKKKKKGRVSGF